MRALSSFHFSLLSWIFFPSLLYPLFSSSFSQILYRGALLYSHRLHFHLLSSEIRFMLRRIECWHRLLIARRTDIMWLNHPDFQFRVDNSISSSIQSHMLLVYYFSLCQSRFLSTSECISEQRRAIMANRRTNAILKRLNLQTLRFYDYVKSFRDIPYEEYFWQTISYLAAELLL